MRKANPIVVLSQRLVPCVFVLLMGLLADGATTARASFGLRSLRFGIEAAAPLGSEPGAAGPSDTQAGSHPFRVNIAFAFRRTLDAQGSTIPDGAVKDVRVELPPGLMGSVTDIPQCEVQAFEHSFFLTQGCPASAEVGTMTLDTTFLNITLPVFNLQPPPGVAAQLGVFAVLSPAIMGVSIRTGSDYGLTVELRNLPQFLPVLGGSLALWGVPADKRHDPLRGACMNFDGTSNGECPTDAQPDPFLTLPMSCGHIIETTILADSWEAPGSFVEGKASFTDNEGNALALTGCERLDFSPSVQIQAESAVADGASGLRVDVGIPQHNGADGLAESIVRDAEVTLPAGLSINPSAADGLRGCQPQQVSLDDASPVTCPDSSRIGSVSIESPLLAQPLQGTLYLAAPRQNAFASLLAVYVFAQRDGIAVKLAGRIDANPITGQLTLALHDMPELPFSRLTFSFDGGARAALAMPASCGSFPTIVRLAPYSAPAGSLPATLESRLTIDQGCMGGFSPSFLAGATSPLAGRDTGFALQLTRGQGEQDIDSLFATLPQGLLAHLGGIPLCGELPAAAGGCDPASRIGSVSIAAGAGPHPFYFAGQVFLTGPYRNAPFGLSIVVPGIAGPFDLGTVVLRARVLIDPLDAHMTIATDSLPQILQGIPLRIRGVYLTVDRPGFMLDPTSCASQQVSATVLSTDGGQVSLASPFAVTGCADLPFSPRLSAHTAARVDRARGAALNIAIRNPAHTQANIRALSVGLPSQFSPRLTAIQAACAQATFLADPAACPRSAVVGHAALRTPILDATLSGPAYLVSGGRNAVPRLALALEGQNIALRILGSLTVSPQGGVIASFASMPDAPISAFTLRLPQGPGSVFGANFLGNRHASLCGRHLSLPIAIVAHSGVRVARITGVSIDGCDERGAMARHG